MRGLLPCAAFVFDHGNVVFEEEAGRFEWSDLSSNRPYSKAYIHLGELSALAS